MTVCFRLLALTRWDSISNRLTEKITRSGIFMRTFIRLFCDRPAFESLWLALKCWVRRNAISRRNTQLRSYGKQKSRSIYGCAGFASDADAVALPTENRLGCGRYPLRVRM